MSREAEWGAAADEVMAVWPVTGMTVLDEVSSYPTRRVLHLHGEQGDVAAKIDLEPASAAAMERRLGVLDHVASRGYRHAPALLRTSAGTRTSSTPSGVMTLLEYIPAPLTTGDPDRIAGWGDLGAAAARLNSIKDYDLLFAVSVGGAAEELVAQAAGTPLEDGVRSLLGRVERLMDIDEGLIHGEINEANARRRADGEVVLLDWDQAGVGPLALEQGYPLITAFVSENLAVDRDSARAFYLSYTGVGGRIDYDRLFDAAIFHALRYMWFGDVARRWERILFALSHEDLLSSLASPHH